MSDDMISVPRVQLQAIFDLAVHSMDFGSGFWDTEETNSARAIAVLLGVDPSVATPHGHQPNYPHPFNPRPSITEGVFVCADCSNYQGWFTHHAEDGRPY